VSSAREAEREEIADDQFGCPCSCCYSKVRLRIWHLRHSIAGDDEHGSFPTHQWHLSTRAVGELEEREKEQGSKTDQYLIVPSLKVRSPFKTTFVPGRRLDKSRGVPEGILKDPILMVVHFFALMVKVKESKVYSQNEGNSFKGAARSTGKNRRGTNLATSLIELIVPVHLLDRESARTRGVEARSRRVGRLSMIRVVETKGERRWGWRETIFEG
jgi:hypothetical protein